MTAATAFAVVGPSGAGKDSVIAAVAAARPDVLAVRRVVTRPSDPTEPFEPRSRKDFAADRAAGRFVLDWDAHGLSYGIPNAARTAQLSGQTLLVNLSRAVLPQAAQALAPLQVIHLTATPEVLTGRLSARGREDDEDIDLRLRAADAPLPRVAGLSVHRIDNSGLLHHAVAAVLALLPPPLIDMTLNRPDPT